jgi:cyclopropane fatty-acyl-phospholipid synthase-like methyltransferase
MMKSLEESVVTSMDGSDTEIFPYLSYILQDIWEIGTSPEIIKCLIQKHAKDYAYLRVLDLGCGKGAVSIQLAESLHCNCYGIDALKDFIDEANTKAREYEVDSLCRFEVSDIRLKIRELSGFDVIILGAIGPVMGDYYSTLSKCLHDTGLIIVDDGYSNNDSDHTHPLIQKKANIIEQIDKAGMQLIDEAISSKDDIKNSDDHIFKNLRNRCNELINKYPEKGKLFENYIKKQEEENDVLETKVVCSTMVIQKI